jgi:putative endonuclease
MSAWVYMLRCADGSYYVGSARGDDLGKRIGEHAAGAYAGYTKSRRPVKLVWCEHFQRITDAVLCERQLKGWSRAKKEALIRGDWSGIQQLSRRRAGAPRLNPRPSRLAALAPQDED